MIQAMSNARVFVAVLLVLLSCGPLSAEDSVRVLESASTGGVGALDRSLARLSTHKRLMVVAAHPDDEDTRLLALVAQGLGGEAAYLSLSRGEGGQNLIGPELGVGLGLIRSRELLAARRIDGARQFFTRAFDFGYTRSIDETRTLWPEDALLADAVRVIRRFKPQVVVAVFPADARSGHGQHWLSGAIAPRAVVAAGEPVGEGEPGQTPWRPEAFYRSSWVAPASTTVRLPLGLIDPATGRSIFQLALDSRSQHRSQDMGLIQPLGDATTALTWEAGVTEPGAPTSSDGEDVFAGIDTRLAALAGSLPLGDLRTNAEATLEQVATLARTARAGLTPRAMANAVDPLRAIVALLRGLADRLAETNAPGARAVWELVLEKHEIAVDALMTAAGIAIDAYTARETVVAGTRFDVHAVLWNSGDRVLDEIAVDVAEDAGGNAVGDDAWVAIETRDAEPTRSRFATSVTLDRVLDIAVPASASPTVPYFLRRPRDGFLYDWSAATDDERGEPFGRPPLRVRFLFEIGDTPVSVVREVVYRTVDQALGEVRRPLRVVPALEVAVAPSSLVWRIGETREAVLRVEVRSHVVESTDATITVWAPDGWPDVPPVAVAVAGGDRMSVEIPVMAPDELTPGRHRFEVTAKDANGQRFALGVPVVDYEHVRPTPMPVRATVDVSAGEIALPSLRRVGYVRGASDRVPEALMSIGVPIEMLDGPALADSPLGDFDVIVIGSRAYETDPALVAANERLLAYARGGGVLIVQYQQYAFVRGGFAPLPLDIACPHGRATDEQTPVRMLVPDHPVFQVPNRIGDRDWSGWVQERGLYFADTWDPAYAPLLAMADPEGVERQGVLLVAPIGSGHYVYTGLAFFRQLPAGVTGAFRLFANLLSLGSDS